MVGRWARDIAYALLRLGWNARWEDIRDEFIKNKHIYPQASDFLDREARGETSASGSWPNMAGKFGKHSTTSKLKDKDSQKIFRHMDGNRKKNKGHWELLYYDMGWDDEFVCPEHLESDVIGNYHCNPKVSRFLIGFDFPDEPGDVYLISNPAWKGWLKCGKAGSVSSRLSSYQTGSPHRDYEPEFSRYFLDCGAAEKRAHRLLRARATDWKNEWFEISLSDAKDILRSL